MYCFFLLTLYVFFVPLIASSECVAFLGWVMVISIHIKVCTSVGVFINIYSPCSVMSGSFPLDPGTYWELWVHPTTNFLKFSLLCLNDFLGGGGKCLENTTRRSRFSSF